MITVFIFKWIELMMPLNLRENNKARHEIENKIHFYWHSCTPAPLIFLSTIAHINICKPFLSILFCHLSRPLLYNTIKNIYKHNFVTGALCCYKDSIDASLSIGQCTFIQGHESLECVALLQLLQSVLCLTPCCIANLTASQ